jgi:hypothetical protein|tara:strand:+ start:401 stop:643 length:243 start_codon:yes stop_codon:yes gene_type:complete
MAINFKMFEQAFNKSANLEENKLSDGTINWNFVDADLCLAGWDTKIGDEFETIFVKMADDFLLDQAGDRLEVLKRDYLGQ